jgi:PAS domain S-box-containing protein
MNTVDFRHIFESMPGRYLVLSPDFEIVAASAAYSDGTLMLGGGLVGRRLFDVFPAAADDAGARRLRASLERVLETRLPDLMAVAKFDLRMPDGRSEERYMRASNTPLLDETGAVSSIIHHLEDVTTEALREREHQVRSDTHETRFRETTLRAHRTEAQLADANARLQMTLSAGEVGTWLWDSVHDRVVADANLARMFGVSAEEANGAPLAVYIRAIHPDDRARVEAAIASSLTDGHTFEAEYRLVQRDGSVRWALARGRVERDSEGRILGLPGVVLDITDRRMLTEKVEQQARIFDTTLSSITDFAYIFDRHGRFAYVNQALLSLWGLTLQEAVGKDFFDLQYPDELAARLQRQIQHVFDTGEHLRDETPYTSPTGAGGYYEYIFAPVRGAAGEIEVVAGSTRDITARKAVERERERLQEENTQLLRAERAARAEAERLGHAKDEFLATLSHELRTPLNAILGWAQILRRGQQSAETVARGLAVIERNAQVQRQLIADLLDMSRIASGKVRLELQRVDMKEIIGAAVLALEPAADAKQLSVRTVLDGGGLWGDANRLQQVIWNLLSNAVKFTPPGGTIEIVERRSGGRIEISVHDTGQGIDPEFLPYVFDRFRQSDASTTRSHGGLGLGLAIVKTLVELHGGQVSVESPGPGQGAIFVVSLPDTIANPLPGRRQEVLAGRHQPDELPEFHCDPDLFTGLKVLVVDDDPDGRDLIARILRECAADVALADSATEALKMFAEFKPDVLVSDIGMPGVDGYELMRRVRGLGPQNRGTIPAAALTALARPEDRTRALLAGFQTHIAKPVDAVELIAAVAALSGRTAGPSRPSRDR